MDNSLYTNGSSAFPRKTERPSMDAGRGAQQNWARGHTDRDPLFPEPDVGVGRSFNGGASRYDT
jgi:hypothetical protein